jgi:putative nucleotidyltransferase with HDIG domain
MNIKELVKKIPHIDELEKISAKRKIAVWLVGGVLRDFYLGKDKELVDFDFCVEKDTFELVKAFSRKLKAKFIVLDKELDCYRMIIKKQDKILTYDFSKLRGKDLSHDLVLRDFTVNTLALRIGDKDFKLIDELSACRDIDKKILRLPQARVLKDDPLRILRAFSFMANYGFKIDKAAFKPIAAYKKLLSRVSGERLCEEIFKIFGAGDSYSAVMLMDKIRVLDEIFPAIDACRGVHQGGYHHLDVWAHSLETLKMFEELLKNELGKDKEAMEYLNQNLASNHSRKQLIKIACLLHDIGKPRAQKQGETRTLFYEHEKIGAEAAKKIAKKLKFSGAEIQSLERLIFWHLRPGYLADQETPTDRAVYHFFRDTGEDGIAVIALSLADWRATRGKQVNAIKRRRHEKIMLGLIRRKFEEARKKPLPKIINGYDVMKKFNLKPSPMIGVILSKVKEEQALGKITDKEQAYQLAEGIIKQQGDKNLKFDI